MEHYTGWARDLACKLLERPLPRRWAHTQGVACRARSLAPILGGHVDTVEAAAWLHDIGYSPTLVVTGFHPLDGARYLRDVELAPEVICRLVAHHSCAVIEADERGHGAELAYEFPPPPRRLLDALTFCDITTSPHGVHVSVTQRIAEIKQRYGAGHVVTRFIARATPDLMQAVWAVESRMRLPEVWSGAGQVVADSRSL